MEAPYRNVAFSMRLSQVTLRGALAGSSDTGAMHSDGTHSLRASRAILFCFPSSSAQYSRMRGFLAMSLLLAGWSCLGFGCHDDLHCGDETADCAGRSSDCYSTCDGEACQLSCHDVGGWCWGKCDADCSFQCNRAGSGCTAFCADRCAVDCHDSPLCAGICGPECRYTCSSAIDCEVQVGGGSVVECRDLTYCLVQCDGPCALHFDGVGSATLLCADGQRLDGAASGTFTCGDPPAN